MHSFILQQRLTTKGPRRVPSNHFIDPSFDGRTSDDVHVEHLHHAVEVASDHLLAVASHNTLTWREVFRCEDRWRNDEWNVWAVDVARLEVASALVSDKDLVPWEVRILVDREAVGNRSDVLCTDGEWRTHLAVAVHRELWLVEHGALKDGANVWARDDEVRRTAKRLPVDRVCHVDDRLDQRLVPFADGARELWSDAEAVRKVLRLTGQLVDELAWSAAPVHDRAVCLGDQVVEDLAIDFECNLLREDARELDLCVHRVIRVEVLGHFWRPACTELTARSRDCDRLDLDVDLRDDRRRSWDAEISFERWKRECCTNAVAALE